jgi:hypothetical protein
LFLGYRIWPQPLNRTLTKGEEDTLHNLLFQNPGKIAIRTKGDNREAYDYAEKWFVVFYGAHWDVGQDVGSQFGGGPPPKGLQIQYVQGKEGAANFVLNSLKKALGDSIVVEKDLVRPGPEELTLLVGQKPN